MADKDYAISTIEGDHRRHGSDCLFLIRYESDNGKRSFFVSTLEIEDTCIYLKSVNEVLHYNKLESATHITQDEAMIIIKRQDEVIQLVREFIYYLTESDLDIASLFESLNSALKKCP